MNVLSVCDGMSCGQIALEKAGIEIDKYFASEIDSHAMKVTMNNYPNTRQLGDVNDYRGWFLPKIDLMMAGTPCQDLSVIKGKDGKGLHGEKSKLFFTFVKALERFQPEYFLLENVMMKQESNDIISKILGVEPVMINSGNFSAQSRERLYWTNIPFNKTLPTSSGVLKDVLESEVDPKYFYDQDFDFHGFDSTVCATLHIKGHDLLKRVNSPFAKCQTLTAVCGGNQQKKVLVDDRVRKLTPLEYERLQTVPEGYTASVSDSQRYKMLGNGWTVDVIAHILGGLKNGSMESL